MTLKKTLTACRTRFDEGLAHVHCAVYSLGCPLIRQAIRTIPPGHLLYALYISNRYRYVYVDNPKTGCSSLKSALVELETRGIRPDMDCYDWTVVHNRDRSPLLQLTGLGSLRPLSDLVEQGYRFFSFVRNPYTRLLSGYRDKIRKPHYRQELLRLMGKPPDQLEYPISFAEFVQIITAQSDYNMNPHWRPQTTQILHELIDYSFLGRFEQYNTDFVRLFQHLGIEEDNMPALRNLNWNQDGSAVDLSEYYTPAVKEQVYQRYRKDFDALGYEP